MNTILRVSLLYRLGWRDPPPPPPATQLGKRVLRVKAKKRASLTIDCPAGPKCSGEIAILDKQRKDDLVKKRSYSVRGGRSDPIKLMLTPGARKALRNRRTLVGKGVLTADNGAVAEFKAVLKG